MLIQKLEVGSGKLEAKKGFPILLLRFPLSTSIFYLFSKGVALLQALIMVNVMALTAAAMMIVIMSGFMGTAVVEQSIDNRAAAEAAIGMAYEDLQCYDPDVNGTFSTPSGCTPLCLQGGCAVNFCRSDPPGSCYGDATTVPTPAAGGISMAYDVDGAGSLPIVAVNFSYVSSSYTLSARGNVQQ